MIELFDCLIGTEFDLYSFADTLLFLGCNNILEYDNIKEILKTGKILVTCRNSFSVYILFSYIDGYIYVNDFVDL